MTLDPVTRAWAMSRALGPLAVPLDEPAPAGMIRLADESSAWLVPEVPESADSRVLAGLGLTAPVVDQPNDTARVLAAALRLCWINPDERIWPGATVSIDAVHSLFTKVVDGRDPAATHRAALAGMRRLAGTGWLLLDEDAGQLRLGPRVALWRPADLTTLRQLWRSMSWLVEEQQ